jgi:DNA-binding transcriptional regulator YdaS (Cro superfamily)
LRCAKLIDMNLTTYLEQTRSSTALAKAIGVSPVMVSLWKTGARPVPIERCVAIEQATGGAVTRRDLRPDDWHLIWPELAQKAAA